MSSTNAGAHLTALVAIPTVPGITMAARPELNDDWTPAADREIDSICFVDCNVGVGDQVSSRDLFHSESAGENA